MGRKFTGECFYWDHPELADVARNCEYKNSQYCRPRRNLACYKWLIAKKCI